MKNYKLISILAISLLSVSMVMGQITDSAHDFKAAGWNTTGEICATCHTPHNAIADKDPLWNHAVTATVFTLYGGTDLEFTPGQPDGASLLCLSCHDGTVALDNFGGVGGNTSNTFISGNENLGTTLADDHPVSFVYADAANGDAEINPSTASMGSGTIADYLEGTKMQCSTCHDVHGNGNTNLLQVVNTASALCLTCHGK